MASKNHENSVNTATKCGSNGYVNVVTDHGANFAQFVVIIIKLWFLGPQPNFFYSPKLRLVPSSSWAPSYCSLLILEFKTVNIVLSHSTPLSTPNHLVQKEPKVEISKTQIGPHLLKVKRKNVSKSFIRLLHSSG